MDFKKKVELYIWPKAVKPDHVALYALYCLYYIKSCFVALLPYFLSSIDPNSCPLTPENICKVLELIPFVKLELS